MLTSGELANYLASFPKGTPIYLNGPLGDVRLNCESIELFLPIGELETPDYLILTDIMEDIMEDINGS